MIYISSSSVQSKSIGNAVEILVNQGYKNIELSGGTNYYAGIEDDLLSLKERFELNYQAHNYFPPPTRDFIINLASVDEDVYRASVDHMEKAIHLSSRLGGRKFGFHAGFYIPIKMDEIGKQISSTKLEDIGQSKHQFYKAYRYLNKIAEEANVQLYIENNVYSKSNYKNFGSEVPFMLLHSEDYLEMKEEIDFTLLLDIAHLKVSCATLGLDFEKEFNFFMACTDYIHVSSNDGCHDTNEAIHDDELLFSLLKKEDLLDKTITLEIYDDFDNIGLSYKKLLSLIN